ncbi:prepilin-type N-terminal cleavage/methylation domain-containing protein [Diaphorobacter sp.]|uniref:type II secretion system protein n=1 Tax=Diaphorobacter sp. TaxID=1934310 RepID=UPI002588BCBC|nr:prepilin-type N-terminal cleavage/methylation domain-containing protein [Diaphorobacter sp.]
MTGRHAQHGLTLLELLVAFAIMAMSVGMIYRIMGGNARNAGELETRQRAVVLAQSLLALRDTVPEGGLQLSGESGGYRWSIHSALYDTGVAGPSVTPLHELAIVIAWDDGGRRRSLELTTLRPQRKPSPQVRK